MTTTPISELKSLVKARVPIIWVLTHEETRLTVEFLKEISIPLNMFTYSWSCCSGLVPTMEANKKSTKEIPNTANAKAALDAIATMERPAGCNGTIFLMKDLSVALQTLEIRQLRDLYQHLSDTNKIIIIVSPILAHGPGGQKEGLPPTLEKQVAVVEYNLPTFDQINQKLRGITTVIKESTKQTKTNTKLDYTDTEYDECTRVLRGLTIMETENAVASCLSDHMKLDPEILLSSKRQIIRKSQILEFIEPSITIDDVGGLDLVKEYLLRYVKSFSQEARDFGVEPIKMLLLVGIPGNGKSLIAKTLGHLFKIPLLKFDIGRVYGSLVGMSEQRMRETILLAESMAPCCLFIDELEKGLSGTKSSNSSDGGTTSRVFGTLLTALQDGMKDVIVVGCVKGDTIVASGDGKLVPITSLIENISESELYSVNPSNGQIWNEKPAFSVQPVANEYYRITTSSSFLECSHNHPLFCFAQDGLVEIEARKIQKGDFVASPFTLPEVNTNKYVSLSPVEKTHFNQKNIVLPSFLDENVAWWAGYTTGDGGQNRINKHLIPHRISWYDQNIELGNILKTYNQELFNLNTKVFKYKNRGGYYFYTDSSILGKWTQSNFPGAIIAHGPNRYVSDAICMSNNKVIASFLRGLYDAEGSVSGHSIEFTTTSKIMVQQVLALLKRFSIQATLKYGLKRTSYTKNIVYSLYISGIKQINIFNELIGFFHPEKQKSLDALINQKRSNGNIGTSYQVSSVPVLIYIFERILQRYNLKASILKYFRNIRFSYKNKDIVTINREIYSEWITELDKKVLVKDNDIERIRSFLEYRWDKVKKVSRIEERVQLYDLNMPKFHNYVANSLMVHNTANNIEAVPPEFIRRANEVFFVDLPSADERWDIFKIHLRLRNRDIKTFESTKKQILLTTENFTGAEIEKCVKDSIVRAFYSGATEVKPEHLLASIQDTKPIYQIMSEQIKALQDWAKGHAKYASSASGNSPNPGESVTGMERFINKARN